MSAARLLRRQNKKTALSDRLQKIEANRTDTKLPPHPFHRITVNQDGKLWGVKSQVLNQQDKIRFDIAGVRFECSIKGRGLNGFLEVRCLDGALNIEPNVSNVVHIRLGRPT